MFSYIGLMRDPRASKDMVPDDVWEMMLPDPEIETLEAEKAQLKGGQCWIKCSEHEDRIRELTRLIAAKVARRKNDIRRAYQEDYFYNRPTWDRAQLAEILCNQPDNLSSTELLELRILAAELMVVLCGKRETVKRNRIQRRARADVKVKEESPGPDLFPLLMDRKQCPHCIGDETLSFEERTFKKHTQQLGSVKQMSCNHPKCRRKALESKHLNYCKNHIEKVHDVKLRA
ncbi:FluG domain-containing protein [Podospora fimiseda]|uniref:FluG domain-containing protein n=1 Tax=Podospora fimiseda TaxID=252190 RepID=A0AAN7BC83_9PEZI|nr:FluG domain-containing protein [Podospora fimiseda]